MNIIDKRTEAESIYFMDVKCGMSFECGQNNFYMKTDKGHDTNDNFTNAVNLKNGMLCIFSDLEKVILVDASIVIN